MGDDEVVCSVADDEHGKGDEHDEDDQGDVESAVLVEIAGDPDSHTGGQRHLPNAKLVLPFSSATGAANIEAFATTEAIQCTEIYEFVQRPSHAFRYRINV